MATHRGALRRSAVSPSVWPWLLPLGLLLGLFYLYPALDVLRLSFTDASLTDPGYSYSFDSYASVFSDPDFPGILLATIIFVGGSIIGQVFLGLCVALALNAGVRRRLPASGRQSGHPPFR